MRALVTGAAGFIGSQLSERLARSGCDVRALDCLTPYYDVAIKMANAQRLGTLDRVSWRDDDLRDADCDAVLDGIDVVFHLAAQPGVRKSWSDFDAYQSHNVLATQRLLDAAVRRPLTRFVFASSSSVYGQVVGAVDESSPTRPHSPYGVTKLSAESLCTAYAANFGVPTVSLRLFTVYGPRQRPDMAIHRLIRSAMSGEPFPMFGDGSQERSFTYVGDVIDAALSTVDASVAPGAVFNIAGGASASLLEVIAAVEDATGRRVTVDRRDAQPGDVARTDGLVTAALRQLSWSPSTSLEDGIRQQVAAFDE